jgi:hypothetical protein
MLLFAEFSCKKVMNKIVQVIEKSAILFNGIDSRRYLKIPGALLYVPYLANGFRGEHKREVNG